MLMPVLRLLLIYCILALAVVGVIERDVVRRFVFGEPQPVASASQDAPAGVPATVAAGDGDTDAATALSTEVAQIAPAPAPAPVPAPTEAASQPGPVTEATAAGSASPAPATPAPGQIAELQAPVADRGAPAAPTAEPVYPPAPDQARAPAPAPAGAGGSIGDARAAYWAGDYARAGDILNALASVKPDDPDVIGELGNLQYARRDFAGAAASYLRAGELLAAQGHADRAQVLVAVLQQIDQAKAAALVKRLQGR